MKYYLQTYTPRVKNFQSTDDPMNYRVITVAPPGDGSFFPGGVKNHRPMNMQTGALSIGLIPKSYSATCTCFDLATETKLS
jgi:hypothetical protein